MQIQSYLFSFDRWGHIEQVNFDPISGRSLVSSDTGYAQCLQWSSHFVRNGNGSTSTAHHFVL